MKYYKNVLDGFVCSIEERKTTSNGIEITQEEYENILAISRTRPQAPEGYMHRLNENLEWVLHEMERVENEPTDEEYSEAGKILLGVNE